MIIYEENGVVHSCSLMSSVPDGITGYEVEAPTDKEFRDAWVINAGALDIDLDKAKAIKVKQAQAEATTMMKVITDQYSQDEIDTWTMQEEEARGNKPDDYLTLLSLYSNIPLADLKAKIIANADAFKALSAEAVGRRQGMEKNCMAATTLDELKAVTF